MSKVRKLMNWIGLKCNVGKEELITVNVGNVRYRHGGGISENFPLNVVLKNRAE